MVDGLTGFGQGDTRSEVDLAEEFVVDQENNQPPVCLGGDVDSAER